MRRTPAFAQRASNDLLILRGSIACPVLVVNTKSVFGLRSDDPGDPLEAPVAVRPAQPLRQIVQNGCRIVRQACLADRHSGPPSQQAAYRYAHRPLSFVGTSSMLSANTGWPNS